VIGLYLIGLLVALIGMVVLDLRFRLFFARAPRRAAIVLVLGVAFFLAWDLAGVGLHIFFPGGSGWLLGVQLAPEVPLEELFFLMLLCYLTMNVYGALARWSRSRHSRRVETGGPR
jgi:lycopene cyclase domain-containing protein